MGPSLDDEEKMEKENSKRRVPSCYMHTLPIPEPQETPQKERKTEKKNGKEEEEMTNNGKLAPRHIAI